MVYLFTLTKSFLGICCKPLEFHFFLMVCLLYERTHIIFLYNYFTLLRVFHTSVSFSQEFVRQQVCCIGTTMIHIHMHAETKSTIMTNELTSLEKYTSHTLFEMVAKGLCVRGELETEKTATYWPPVPLPLAVLLSRPIGPLNRGSWGPIVLCWVLVLSTASYLQITDSK